MTDHNHGDLRQGIVDTCREIIETVSIRAHPAIFRTEFQTAC